MVQYPQQKHDGCDPIPGDDFVRRELLECFPRGYFVLLGFIVRFELLKQDLSENVPIIVV